MKIELVRPRKENWFSFLTFVFQLLMFGMAVFTNPGPSLAGVLPNDDSASLNGAPPLPGTNCPNIQTQWYAAGQTPPGYYKSNGDGNCYPIPACPGNCQDSGAPAPVF